MKNLTAERLREVYDYDGMTGAFIRRVRSGALKAGNASAYVAHNGYAVVGVDYKRYAAHRLAWLYVHGKWPDGEIDHINGDRADNRITNLRPASRALNAQNRRRPLGNNKSGYLGVCAYQGRYRATISIDGRCRLIGVYDSPAEAAEAYVAAKREFHKGCTL